MMLKYTFRYNTIVMICKTVCAVDRRYMLKQNNKKICKKTRRCLPC